MTETKSELSCNSCGKHVISEKVFVKFDCPNCGEEEIIRCERCKIHSNKYKCGNCDFEGP